jgi:hypothetical protein
MIWGSRITLFHGVLVEYSIGSQVRPRCHEVLGYAFNRQGFLTESYISYLMTPARSPFFIPYFRINLPDPPGIPVAGRSNQDVLMEPSKEEIL